MKKNKTKSILVCAVLASVLGGVMPVYAEGETPAVQHRYQLVQGIEWHDGDAVPYGSVVKKADDGKYYLYKIRTGNATPWGRVGRGLVTPAEDKQITLQYNWGTNGLTKLESGTGDITVIYDGTKVVDTRQTGIDSTITAYVQAQGDEFGGAIYNEGTMTSVTGDFIGNYVSSTNNVALGGAIYNDIKAQIGNITGDFIGNYALGNDAFGGAINNGGTINDISGDFIGNYASGDVAYGGAINNGGTINDISGDFIGNYASSTNNVAFGGAIFNWGIINDITGDFIGNYVSSTNNVAHGGAIYNKIEAQIGNITGDFIGNYASSTNNVAQGGAIYNSRDAQIGNITGDFIGNYASSTNNVAYGGAIYNEGTMTSVTGDFIGNYVSSTNNVAHGGAIYNQGGTISILAGDRDVLFSGNRVSASNSANARGGAIYNSGKMSLYATSGHSITFEGDASDANTDSIYNVGTLNINDTENNYTGMVNLANVDGDGTMNINGGTVKVKGNITQNIVKLAADASLNVTGTLSMNNGHFTVETDMANSSANCVTLGELILNGNLTISVCDIGVVSNKGSVTLDNIPVLTVNSGSLPEDKISSANVIVSNVLFAPTITFNGNSVYLTKLEYEAVHHRYQLDNGVVKTREVQGTITPWGLVGRGLSAGTGVTLKYKWDTDGNGLIPSNPGTSDITVIYDGTNKVSERQDSIDSNITAYVGANSTLNGGVLYNNEDKSGTNITADFIGNFVSLDLHVYGGAIYNVQNAQTGNITGDFIGNHALGNDAQGGAIYNLGTINNITGDFIGNYASGSSTLGGAIYNGGTINNITGDFIGSYSKGDSAYGGAIYNYGNAQIGNITGDFISNYATGSSRAEGGAIYNERGTISILAGDRDVLFSDNRVSASDSANAQGGAIYNHWSTGSTVNLYAAADYAITFKGDASDDNTDSIYNVGTLNINSTANNYTGTVNLAKVEGGGTMNVNGGTVNVNGNITQNTLNISGGTLDVTGHITASNINFQSGSTLKVDGTKITETAAITDITSATVASGSKLYVSNAVKDTTYKILDGSGINVSSWTTDGDMGEGFRASYGLIVDIDNTTTAGTGLSEFHIQFKEDPVATGSSDIGNIITHLPAGSEAKAWIDNISVHQPDVQTQGNTVNTMANIGSLANVQGGVSAMCNFTSNSIAANIGSESRPMLGGGHGSGIRNVSANAKDSNAQIETVEQGKASEVMPTQYEEQKYGKEVWASFIHSKTKIEGMKTGHLEQNSTLQYNGTVVGVDLWSGRHGFGGVALTYGNGNFHSDQMVSKVKNDADYYGINVYNRQDVGKFSFQYDAGFTYAKNDVTMSTTGAEDVTAKPKVRAYSAGIKVEEPIKVGRATEVVPFAGARYTFVKSKEYQNSLGLGYDVDNQHLVKIPVGMSLRTKYLDKSGWKLGTTLSGGYSWNLCNRSSQQRVSFGGYSDMIDFDIADRGEYFINAAVQAEYENLLFELGYNYSKGKTTRSNKWYVSANLGF